MRRTTKLKLRFFRVLLSVLLTVSSQSALGPASMAAPPIPPAEIASVIDQLEDAHRKANWQKVEESLDMLIRIGPEKMPMLVQKLMNQGTTKNVKLSLIQAISRTEGDAATDALLDISVSDPEPEASRMAGILINNRIIRKAIPEERLDILISRIESKADGIAAGQWAYVLGRAEQVKSPKLAQALVKRFINELEETKRKELPPVRDTYLNPKAWYLNILLRPFLDIDPTETQPLLKDAIVAAKDDETKKWLLIACGFAADKAVADDLRKIVEDKTEELSVRALALRGYARALKDGSEPLLRAYENDASSAPNSTKMSPLRIIAHDELAELHKKPSTLRIQVPKN